MSMSPIQVLLVLHTLMISICTLSCLPVTSKPIENTPEHLAWEAWIMVPSTQDKTRKITPKSIFILPNKTNGGNFGGTNSNQIQCPPGHRVDNSRCIPTVNIDREQILIAQLTNLLHSADKNNGNSGHNPGNFSYEYDYDYGDSYDPEGSESLIQPGQVPSDYNGEPFKINLLLENFPPKDDNKEMENLGPSEDIGEISDILKVQPFRGKETSTTATTIPTPVDATSTSSTTPIPDTTPRSEERNQSIPVYLDLSSNHNTSTASTSAAPIVDATTPIHLLSPSETEIASMVSPAGSETDSGEDISFTDLTTMSTTIQNDEEIDIVTETEETRSDIRKDLMQESFVLDEGVPKNNTELEESTDVLEVATSTFPSSHYQEDETTTSRFDILTTNQHSSTNEDRTTNPLNPVEETNKNESRTNSKLMGHKFPTKVLKTDEDKQRNETPYLQEDVEPFLDTIESNNRFVYHHLGVPFSHPTERITGNTQNIQEQLKIINRIVEENKRRTEQQSRIQFPSNIEEHEQRSHGNDHVRFPDGKASHVPIAHPHYHGHGFTNEQHIWKNHPSGVTPSMATQDQKPNKPLWWLPNGWEVDGNGDRPLLLRFWSRAPVETESISRHRASSNPTTIGYRENSRSPSENLYKEVSAQEVYKVLGTKQWKHNR